MADGNLLSGTFDAVQQTLNHSIELLTENLMKCLSNGVEYSCEGFVETFNVQIATYALMFCTPAAYVRMFQRRVVACANVYVWLTHSPRMLTLGRKRIP